MKIREVLWLRQFAEKIERKHHVSQDEVEQLFLNRPVFQFAERGDVPTEDLYRAIGQTDDGRYLIVFFIHKQRSRALVISLPVTPLEASEDIMAKKKKNHPATKQRDPLPEHFASLEEAAQFWDTHDSADYEEYFVDVDVDVDLKKRSLIVDGRLYDEVRAVAKKKRIPTEKLVARWIKEKLRSAA